MMEGQQGVIPHLVVDDAAAALAFYAEALGAREAMRMPAEDGKRIMHAEIEVNGARIFVRDDFPEFACGADARQATPKALGGTTAVLHLQVANCDAAVKRAAAAGARVVMEPADAFWGDRYGQVVDPFGHSWSFAHPLAAKG